MTVCFAYDKYCPVMIFLANAIVSRKGIEPKYHVFDEVYQHDSREMMIWQHGVGASCALLYCANILFDVRNVLVGHSSILERKLWSIWFKHNVSQY
jgi:hypothetical protein